MTNKDRFADYVGHDRQSAIIRVDGPPRGTLHLTSLSAPVCKESGDTMAYLVFFHKGRLSTSNKTTHRLTGRTRDGIWWHLVDKWGKVMKNIHMEKKSHKVKSCFSCPVYCHLGKNVALLSPWRTGGVLSYHLLYSETVTCCANIFPMILCHLQ